MKTLTASLPTDQLQDHLVRLERRAVLRESFDSAGVSAFGYGEPSEFTSAMYDEGLIDVEFTDNVIPGFWRAFLTKKGQAEREKR